jgi:hypothetical protein
MISSAEKSHNKLKSAKVRSHRVSPVNVRKSTSYYKAPRKEVQIETDIEDIPNELDSEDYEYIEVNESRNRFDSADYTLNDIQVNTKPERNFKKDSILKKEIILKKNMSNHKLHHSCTPLKAKKSSVAAHNMPLNKVSSSRDHLNSLLNQSRSIITKFRTRQSFVEKTRVKMQVKPKASFVRSPERIVEFDPESLNRKNLHGFGNGKERGSSFLRKVPSLLITRRNLSPSKEIARDNYIDTADVILTQEIEIINMLRQTKDKKYYEVEDIRLENMVEKRRIEKLRDLQPKIIKNIGKEHDARK